MKLYPPFMVLIGIGAQLLIGQIAPVSSIIGLGLQSLGVVLLIAGLAAILLTARAFSKEETTIIPDGEPSSLMQNGLFAYSRNPIYVGMAIVLTGSALLSGTYWSLLVPLVFVIAVQQIWIVKEEENMEAEFGQHYRDYKQRVRRWL